MFLSKLIFMSTFFIVCSAFFIALSNFFVRRGVTDGGDHYIMPRFFTAGLVSIPIIYLHHGSVSFDPQMGLVALASGLCLGLLQYSIGRSLQFGPSGLTFIFVSSVCVWPPLVMFLLFGDAFGHGYSLYNLIGSLLVIAGLCWMGSGGKADSSTFTKWLKWIAVGYLATTLFYTLFQWRALLLRPDIPESTLIPFHGNAQAGDIFMAITFFVAALSQLLFRNRTQTTTTTTQGLCMSGCIAGILSGISTYFLLLGTECAESATENAIIFPLNTVMIILFCNIWASRYYNERINWPANALALSGIAISA